MLSYVTKVVSKIRCTHLLCISPHISGLNLLSSWIGELKTSHLHLPNLQCAVLSESKWVTELHWEEPASTPQRPSQMKTPSPYPVVPTPGADYSSNKEVKPGVLFLDLEWTQIQLVMSGIIYQHYLNYIVQDNDVNPDVNQHPCGKHAIVIEV